MHGTGRSRRDPIDPFKHQLLAPLNSSPRWERTQLHRFQLWYQDGANHGTTKVKNDGPMSSYIAIGLRQAGRPRQTCFSLRIT